MVTKNFDSHSRQILGLMILLLLIVPVAVSAQQTIDGFNGYPWGTSYRSMDSLSLGIPDTSAVGEDGEVSLRYFLSGVHQLGVCVFEDVKLSFLDGDLSGATYHGSGPELFKCAYGQLETWFGKPERISTDSEMYSINTSTTDGFLVLSSVNKNVYVSLREDTRSGFLRFARRRAGH